MMRLSELPPRSFARIVGVEGGKGIVQKLSLMGISENKMVRVISSNYGPVVVEVDKNTVAVGRGMAERVNVIRI